MTSHETSAVDAASHGSLVDLLAQSAFTTMGVLSRVAAENDLSLTQLRVCAILRDRRLRMTGLAGFLGLDKSTLSGLVERAEKRGLLARAPSASDGRAVEVFLTAAGDELARQVAGHIAESLGPRLDELTAAEQRRLQGLLAKMQSRVVAPA